MPKEPGKTCFVICPIGEPNSAERKRSDAIMKHIIKPVVGPLGFKPIRADDISKPGVVTSQIIQHLIDDTLVVADLTDGNPNVYYELAVRHVLRKSVVQIIDAKQNPRFDVTTQRTIKLDITDLDSVDGCKTELAKQINAVEQDASLVDSPISQAIDVGALTASGRSSDKILLTILDGLRTIQSTLEQQGNDFWRPATETSSRLTDSEMLKEMRTRIRGVSDALSTVSASTASKKRRRFVEANSVSTGHT